MKELRHYIYEKISQKRAKILGHCTCVPYIKQVGGQEVWVIDVLVRHDCELLRGVPIAENNRQIKNFVTEGTPVEVQRDQAGQCYVSGLSDTQKGTVAKKSYSPMTEGFGFAQGWRYDGSGNVQTGNSNTVGTVTPGTHTYSYTWVTMPYSDLDYGTTPYGYKIEVRV